MGDVIDIVGSLYAPKNDEKLEKPISHTKLHDVFNELDSVINNDLAEKSEIPDDTDDIEYYDSNDKLIARDVYLKNKSYSGSTITGIFRQKNTGTTDSPVWETRYAYSMGTSGAVHLNADSPGIVFPDGSTIASEAFRDTGRVQGIGAEVASGTVTLSNNSAVVDTGETDTSQTYFLALGVQDPNADTKVSGRIFWDDSAGTHKVEFIEESTNVDPTVVYKVIEI